MLLVYSNLLILFIKRKILERSRINRERGKEERNRAWSNKMPLKDRNKNKTTLDRTDYSDSEPIIEHQDNNGILLDEENNDGLNDGKTNSFVPTLADLEFGSAFGTSRDTNWDSSSRSSSFNFNTNVNEINKEKHHHPAPSLVFDDL